MNPAHLHLLVNHVPILGSFFALAILAYGLIRKSPDVTTVALLMFVFVGIAAYGVQLTGEPAEEIVEELPGMSRRLIHAHEEAAELSTRVLMATGVLALLALVLARRKAGAARLATFGVLLLGVAGAGLMARAGNLGGQIRHGEIRGDAAATELREGAPADAGREAGEDDEGGRRGRGGDG